MISHDMPCRPLAPHPDSVRSRIDEQRGQIIWAAGDDQRQSSVHPMLPLLSNIS